MAGPYADRIDMQNRLFAELSRMFGEEVPLYDKSLLVNRECNRVVCDLLGRLHRGFTMSDGQLDRTSSERHGAIRIGRPDEYRWIARFFACFAMEPHNFYDMSNVGAKSQPIIATAFRSTVGPEHRVFTSLLLTDYFDDRTKARIEALLAGRQVFSERAKELIGACERQGGLSWEQASDLIAEGVERIFKWTGRARDFALYNELCDAGFKIAADIACFESHHLNHLTPNTFCMDLYTAAMKRCLGEMDDATFRRRAGLALGRLARAADRDYMRLTFKHLSPAEIDAFEPGAIDESGVRAFVDAIATRLAEPDLALAGLNHAGFKDSTEGPTYDTPVLLRQDAYKALTEPVVFREADGTQTPARHTARFGEIEQRFYATTPEGRALYDDCLAAAERARAEDPSLAGRDFETFERRQVECFAPFPKTLGELVRQGLVHARYEPTPAGLEAAGEIDTTDVWSLVDRGLLRFEGLRYEDFLPVSAAGIFASNLQQYGTTFTAAKKPSYTQADLESIMGRAIVDAATVYRGLEARSLLASYDRLGLLPALEPSRRRELEAWAEEAARQAGDLIHRADAAEHV